MGTWGISPFILKFWDSSAYTDILVQVPAIITSHLPSTKKKKKEQKKEQNQMKILSLPF